MLSKVDGDEYLFTDNGGRFPFRIEKDKVDSVIESLKYDLQHFNDTMKELYEEKYNLYALITDELFFSDDDWYDGESYKIKAMENDLKYFQDFLAEDNDIPEYEDIVVLEDLGFEKRVYGPEGVWVKMVQDSEEKEVTEEVWPYNEPPMYRKCSVLWKRIGPGHKQSEKISYDDLEITDELANAIKNTKEKALK